MWRESREKAGDAWTDILRERWLALTVRLA
jgi:hypothetical protein